MKPEDISCLDSETGVISSLVHHPEWSFYSENLLPNHFTNKDNQILYSAICELAKQEITTIDTFNILNILNASEAMRRYSNNITADSVQEFIETSGGTARETLEEYQLSVKNVMDAAFRRDTLKSLKRCEELCFDMSKDSVEQKIYDVLDNVMAEYSSTNEIPLYSEVIDKCWEEIKSRQGGGYAGIPFKFKTLNEYATIEPGELFVFVAEAKQGKSMMLLNCAIDLLRKDLAVLYLDSELNTRLFTARVAAHLSGVEYRRIIAGSYSEEEGKRIDDAIAWMKTKNFTHLYIPMFDMQSVYTAVKKTKHTHGLDVLIVDYFKSSGDGDAFDSYQELGRFVDTIKNKICGDMGICGIGAAQATASGKVADSAKIGRNASTIAIIQDKTPEEIEADGVECGNKKLRVVLNRNGMQMAPGEYIDLQFDGNHVMYSEAQQHVIQTPF